MIHSVSHSRIVVFEQCKFRAKLQYVDKIPEPERPLPPGKTEHANDRGTRVHEASEYFVKGEGPFIREMKAFESEFNVLRDLYPTGRVSLEGEWGMDEDWNPASWREAYLRLKIDALLFLNECEAVVIDYKTGKKFGNEVKHAEQTQLYALTTFLRHPELEHITTELWYLDQDDITTTEYTREQALRFKTKWSTRFAKMTNAEQFPPNPNRYSCMYCPYGPWGTGHCEKGRK